MSREVDQRVVQMRFDNRDFEEKATQTMSTLDKLKEKLNFKGAEKGLDDFQGAADKVQFSAMEKALDSLDSKVSFTFNAASSIINRFVNSAVDAGLRLSKSLTIDPPMAGFNKYEEKIRATRTIMNATGKSVDEVNEGLELLSLYADETSYSFGDMVTAIGTFSANNVEFDKARDAVMGISNWAALAGKGTAEASIAFRNMAQALSLDAVMARDWMSIQAQGMATPQFKQTVIDTAKELGVLKEGFDGVLRTAKGTAVSIETFDSTLSERWFNGDVLIETLNKYSSYSNKVLKMMQEEGINASEAMERLGIDMDDFAVKAFKSAQEAKTFTDAIVATQDAVNNRWAKAMEIIFGNVEEASELWTAVSNELYELFVTGLDAQNEILQEWKDNGGRDILINTLSIAWSNFKDILEAVKSAVDELFPALTSDDLLKFTKSFQKFVTSLKPSEAALYTLKVAVKAVLLPFKLLFEILAAGMVIVARLTRLTLKFVDVLASCAGDAKKLQYWMMKLFGSKRYVKIMNAYNKISSSIGEAFEKIRDAFNAIISSITGSEKKFSFLEIIAGALSIIAGGILDAVVWGFETLAKIDFSKIADFALNVLGVIVSGFRSLYTFLSPITKGFKGFVDTLKNIPNTGLFETIAKGVIWLKDAFLEFVNGLMSGNIWEVISKRFSGISGAFGEFGRAITDLTKKLDPAKILIFAFGVGLTGALYSLTNLTNAAKNTVNSLKDVLNTFNTLLKGFGKQNPLIRQIAQSILILTASLVILSTIETDKLIKAGIALGAATIAFGILVGALVILEKKLNVLDIKKFRIITDGMLKLSISLVGLAAALKILETVKLSWNLIGALGAVLISLTALAGISWGLSKIQGDIKVTVGMILGFAISINVLVSAIKKLSNANIQDVPKTLTLLAGIIVSLIVISRLIGKVKLSNSFGITVLCLNLLLMTSILKKLAKEKLWKIEKALPAFITLMTLIFALSVAARIAGKEASSAAKSIVAISVSILLLVAAIKAVKKLDKDAIKNGLIVVGNLMVFFAAFALLSNSVRTRLRDFGSNMLKLSGAILILTVAVQYMGRFDLQTLVKGIAAVGLLFVFISQVAKISENSKSLTGTLFGMAAVIGTLMASLMLLSLVDWKDLAKSVIALSTVMIAFGVAIRLMNANAQDQGVIGGIKRMFQILLNFIPMIVMLGGVYLALKYIDDVDNVIEKVVAISTLLFAITACLLAMNLVKKVNWEAAASLALVGVVVAGMVGILYLLQKLPEVTGMIDKLKQLGIVMAGLTALTLVLSLFGKIHGIVVAAAEGAAALAVVVLIIAGTVAIIFTAFGTIMAAIGGIIELIDKYAGDGTVYRLMDKGKEFFIKVGEMIGGFIGGIAAGFMQEAASVLDEVGEELGLFMVNAAPFFEGIGKLSMDHISVLNGLINTFKNLANVSVESFDGKLIKIGQELNRFAPYFVSYANILTDYGSSIDVIERSAAVATSVADFVQKIQWINFDNIKLEGFGQEIESFGNHFANYAKALNQKGVNMSIVKKSNAAAKSIVTWADAIPEQGFLDKLFFGKNEKGILLSFGEDIEAFAPHFAAYALSMSKIKDNFDAVESASDAVATIVTFNNDIPRQGGLASWLGSKNLATYGYQLSTFGAGFLTYYESIIQIGDDVKTKTEEIMDALLYVYNSIPRETTSFSIEGRIASKASMSEVLDFITALNNLSGTINAFVANTKVTEFTSIGQNIIFALCKGFDDNLFMIEERFVMLSKELVDYFNTALDTEGGQSRKFIEVGHFIIRGLVTGITDNAYLAQRAITSVADNILNATLGFFKIQSPSVVMKEEVGVYIVRGIAEGITSDMSAEEAAKQKASNIKQAFQSELEGFNLDIETADLEYEVWEKENPNATEREKSVKKQELLEKKLASKGKALSNAAAAYKTALELFGEDSDQTQELYNEWLKTKSEMLDLASELQEAAGTVNNAEGDLYREWAKSYNSNKDELMKNGFNDFQVRQWVSGQLGGFDPSKVAVGAKKTVEEGLNLSDVNSIIDHYTRDISVEIDNTLTSSAKTGGAGGGGIGSAAGETIAGNVIESIKDKVTDENGNINLLESLKEITGLFTSTDPTGSLANIVDGVISVIDGKGGEAIGKVKTFGLNLISSFEGALGISSGEDDEKESSRAYKDGEAVVDSTISGINSKAENAAEAMKTISENLIGVNTTPGADGKTIPQRGGNEFIEEYAKGAEENEPIIEEALNNTLVEASNLTDKETIGKIKKNSEPIGEYIDDGVQIGIKKNKPETVRQIVILCEAIADAAENTLEINSPSKRFYEMGKFVDLGFVKGIRSYSYQVTEASDDIATMAIDSVAASIMRVNQLIEDEDYAPIIRPVLDLQTVEEGLATLEAEASAQRAAQIALEAKQARRERYEERKKSLGGATLTYGNSDESQNGITFIQNNYSPKAISAEETYMNTKSGLNKFAKMVKS